MRNPFSFARPKGPGFGIASDFYLTVACSARALPSPFLWVNPKGDGNAVDGYCVPLGAEANRPLLNQPMERGAYALASPDKKTVLKAIALPPDEAGFDAEAVARSRFAESIEIEALARLRGAWMLVQVTFQSHDPAVYPSLDFLEACVDRLAYLGDGVVADAIAERYLLPGTTRRIDRVDPRVDARELVSVKYRDTGAEMHCFTLGMRKFVMPEVEVDRVLPSDAARCEAFLYAACQSALLGSPIKPGDRLGSPKVSFEAQPGGLDQAMWEGIDVLELLPPTSRTAHEALMAWEALVREAAGAP